MSVAGAVGSQFPQFSGEGFLGVGIMLLVALTTRRVGTGRHGGYWLLKPVAGYHVGSVLQGCD